MSRQPLTTPLADLWSRLIQPFDAAEAIDTLAGPVPGAARQLVGGIIATSDEAERLLADMPEAIRSLAISTTVKAERCLGQVRGPILWSETVAAQASAAGDMGILVCALPSKAYDTPQNRVLVAALTAVLHGAHAVDGAPAGVLSEHLVHAARRNGSRAGHYLEHRALAGIEARPPSGRTLHRTRSGNRRRTYQKAVAMLARASMPLDAATVEESLAPLLDGRTVAEHRVVAGLLQRAEARGHQPIGLRVSRGTVQGGPLLYRHHRPAFANRTPAGIFIGPVRVEPARAEAGYEPGPTALETASVVVVRGESDLDRALELAGL
jgi:hypothetical protein